MQYEWKTSEQRAEELQAQQEAGHAEYVRREREFLRRCAIERGETVPGEPGPSEAEMNAELDRLAVEYDEWGRQQDCSRIEQVRGLAYDPVLGSPERQIASAMDDN